MKENRTLVLYQPLYSISHVSNYASMSTISSKPQNSLKSFIKINPFYNKTYTVRNNENINIFLQKNAVLSDTSNINGHIEQTIYIYISHYTACPFFLLNENIIKVAIQPNKAPVIAPSINIKIRFGLSLVNGSLGACKYR